MKVSISLSRVLNNFFDKLRPRHTFLSQSCNGGCTETRSNYVVAPFIVEGEGKLKMIKFTMH